MSATDNGSWQLCPVNVLRCPLTGSAVRKLTPGEVSELNERIRLGRARHHDGTRVRSAIDGGFQSTGGPYVYALRDGIHLLLPALAILTAEQDEASPVLRSEKQWVQDFYNELGWEQNEQGDFIDAARFEDLRPVSADYIRDCHARVRRHIEPQGRFLLDAASGPVQYDDYLAYSSGYQARICLDLSYSALRAAQRKVGRHGIYVLGDVTNLPFHDHVMDAVVSLHTIYHVPADEQATAFRELGRVLQPSRSGVVVYAWKRSPWIRAAQLPARLLRTPIRLGAKLLRVLGAAPPRKADRPLYFHAHTYRWFNEQQWPFDHDVLCWRSPTVDLLQSYFHGWFLGRAALNLLYRFEEAHPQTLGRRGAYPMIVIRKPPAAAPALSRAA